MATRRRRSARNKSNRNNKSSTNKSLNDSQITNNGNTDNTNNSNNSNYNDIDYPTLKLEDDDDIDTQQQPQQTQQTQQIQQPLNHQVHHQNNNDSNHNHNHNNNTKQPSSHNNTNNTEQKEHEEDNDNSSEDTKEDSKSLQLSYCRGLSKTPLAVPMVADTNQQSVTRNDAKQITQTRLKRLKELSQRPETSLSKDQKDEKKRIIRLEKNRRAAAMSRRKKKMYVKNLEEKNQLMARHLAISEMENSHLRALLNATQQAQHLPNLANLQNVAASPFHGVGLPAFPQHFKLPHFQIPSLSTTTTTTNTNNSVAETTNNTDTNSVEVCNSTDSNDDAIEINGPVLKKRRLNNGSSSNMNTSTNTNTNTNTNSNSHTLSPSCDNSSDISILEPLPVPIPTTNVVNTTQNTQRVSPPPPPPSHHAPIPINYAHLIPPNMSQLHAPRLWQYGQVPVPPHLLRGHGHIAPMNIGNGTKINNMPKIDKIEAIVIDKDDSEDNKDGDKQEMVDSKSMESLSNDDIPPPVVVSSRMSNEFNMNLLDDDIIDETVDESGSVLPFQQDIKSNMVFL